MATKYHRKFVMVILIVLLMISLVLAEFQANNNDHDDINIAAASFAGPSSSPPISLPHDFSELDTSPLPLNECIEKAYKRCRFYHKLGPIGKFFHQLCVLRHIVRCIKAHAHDGEHMDHLVSETMEEEYSKRYRVHECHSKCDQMHVSEHLNAADRHMQNP